MDFLNISLISSTLFCTLVAGFVLLYAIVVMPGLSKLNDKEFLRAFQVTDGIIQNNQPIFIFVWIGSIISVICLIIVSIVSEGFFNNWVLVLTGFTYLLGVQGITILIHIPLNNNIKKMKINEMDNQNLRLERLEFETKWNFFNKIRTIISLIVSLTFLVIINIQ
tara:strand:+ start:66 stop:560 length:495 start_codon:yes stop_codon:yes gene_type:complete